MQMYKVFVNDCLILLTDTKKVSTNLKQVEFDSVSIEAIVENLLIKKTEGICLLCNDLDECWSIFKSKFKMQKAAGGKVINQKNEVLFIYRFHTWDLPKGKLEKGESIEECAVREVEEECGISNLTIEKQLETTYHIFKRNHKIILKITYWFLMNTSYDGKLTPQIEEGIENVCFKNKKATKEALQNTYENIKLLFKN
jgi:8-oxo-dGTP pyrophosphatase MutT (NUDIX family)